ncbi:MAG: hypothetical protein JOZ47_20435 [Kutzneria sp.]|nr:hypothetical protein [Kutzneria sp.]MBV9847415.1 hypothetical protein [Kutzneria sp.]
MRQFIDTVNAGNKAGANDLLCPRVLGISTPNIDKVTARKGKIGIDPDPRASDPGHAALVVTYGDATTATGTIEFAPYRDNGDLCISLFNVQD